MADMGGVSQIECLDQGGEVVGIGIQIVAVPGLAGPAVPAPVVRDAAIALRRQEEHLVFEGISTERPAMAKDDRLSPAPIFEVDLCSVFHRDRIHVVISPLQVQRNGRYRRDRQADAALEGCRLVLLLALCRSFLDLEWTGRTWDPVSAFSSA